MELVYSEKLPHLKAKAKVTWTLYIQEKIFSEKNGLKEKGR
jgi:hypothetical protein